MHGAVITVRPPDDSLPVVPPVSLPEDDSGAGSVLGAATGEELPTQFEELPHRKPALVSKIEQQLHGTVLELSFTLRAKARVQLLAKRHGRVVAKTRRSTLSPGRHVLRLRLDPEHWPTKLDLDVHPAAGGDK
jgi:hypothetical protein